MEKTETLFEVKQSKHKPMADSVEAAIIKAFTQIEERHLDDVSTLAKKPALIKAARKLDDELDSPKKISIATSTSLKIILEALDALPKVGDINESAFDAIECQLQAYTKAQAAKQAGIA